MNQFIPLWYSPSIASHQLKYSQCLNVSTAQIRRCERRPNRTGAPHAPRAAAFQHPARTESVLGVSDRSTVTASTRTRSTSRRRQRANGRVRLLRAAASRPASAICRTTTGQDLLVSYTAGATNSRRGPALTYLSAGVSSGELHSAWQACDIPVVSPPRNSSDTALRGRAMIEFNSGAHRAATLTKTAASHRSIC